MKVRIRQTAPERFEVQRRSFGIWRNASFNDEYPEYPAVFHTLADAEKWVTSLKKSKEKWDVLMKHKPNVVREYEI